jgi:hypothetical protein
MNYTASGTASINITRHDLRKITRHSLSVILENLPEIARISILVVFTQRWNTA